MMRWLIVLTASLLTLAQAQQYGWTNYTTAEGLGNNFVFGVYAIGSTIYAATQGGLSISTDDGATWTTYTNANSGLGSNTVRRVYASGSTIYAATDIGGVSISTDNGASWTNYTKANSGLVNIQVLDMYASGSTIYAAIWGGLSISFDDGAHWTNYTTANGLGNNFVYGVYASGSTIYAATGGGGLSISTDDGANWMTYTNANSGLGNNFVYDVYASGSTIYAATFGGLSISTNGGTSWTNYTNANGLGNNFVRRVYASGSTIYAATAGGLSISTDDGATWTNYTTAEGLGNNNVFGVYAIGSTIYAATNGGLSVGVPLIPQTITFAALQNRTYGDTFTVNATASSGLAVTFTSATPAVCTTSGINGADITLIAADTCTINADQAGGESGGITYAAAPRVQQSFNVAKKALSVSANDVTITAGDTPTFTATYVGFVTGDDETVLDIPVNFIDNAPDYNTPGIYTITPSGADDANYAITYTAGGTLTIQSAGFTITESDGNTAVTEGAGADTIDVVLTSIPTADVVVTVTPDAQLDVGAGAGTATNLTFTPANWNTAQTINVTAVDDTDIEGDHNGTLTLAVASADADYDGATLADITVAITDNDSVQEPDIQIRNGATTAAESITSRTIEPLRYGTYKRGQAVTLNFLVRNPGAKVLELGELSLPSFFSNAGEPLPATLNSFESALLTIEVDTSAAGTFTGQVSLASNDPDANENPFVFDVIVTVSNEPANALNILPGIDIGDITTAAGEDNVVLLSFKLLVPAGSTSVTVDSLTLAASNAGIERASNLRLYIDGGTRGELDNRDVFLSSTDDIEALTFTFPARTFSPNVPMWFVVVGDF